MERAELLSELDYDPLSDSLELELDPLLDCEDEFSDELDSSDSYCGGLCMFAITLGCGIGNIGGIGCLR